MKVFCRLMIISILLLVAVPTWAGSAVQIFNCMQDDEASDADLEVVASAWLKAAKGMAGGENINAYLRFPVVGTMGEADFAFVIEAPNLKEWGEFTEGYPGSPASKVDDDFNNLADCPDSTLWEGIRVK